MSVQRWLVACPKTPLCVVHPALQGQCSLEDVNDTPMSPDVANLIAVPDSLNSQENVGQLDCMLVSSATAGSYRCRSAAE